jgi:hypothetical protein
MESGLEGLGFCGEKSDPAREPHLYLCRSGQLLITSSFLTDLPSE